MGRKIRGNPVLIVAVLGGAVFGWFTHGGLIAALLVDLAKEFHTTVAIVGQLAAITASTWALSAMLIGPFSDRFGHKRVLVLGLSLFGAAAICFSTSSSYSALVGFSIMFGLAGSMVGPNVLAIIGDHFQPAIRGRASSGVNIGTPLAALIGVPLGALIAGHLGWRLSFILVGFFFAAIAIAALIIIPSQQAQHPAKRPGYLSNFKVAFHNRALLPLILSNMLVMSAYWIIATYLAAFLIQTYSLSITTVAPLLSVIAAVQLIGMVAGGPLADKVSKSRICAATQAIAGLVSVALMIITSNMWLSVALGGLFMGLATSNRPAFFSLIIGVSSAARGTVTGLQATSNHVARALGATTGGLVLALAGYTHLGTLCLLYSILGAAGFFYTSLLLRKMPEGAVEGMT